MPKAKDTLARTMARAIGKPDSYSARRIPVCRKCSASAVGRMADRKQEAANRPALDKACADKEDQAKNGDDQSQGAKRRHVHEGHTELLEVHEGHQDEAGFRAAMKKARQPVAPGTHPLLIISNFSRFSHNVKWKKRMYLRRAPIAHQCVEFVCLSA
jgi:hypothetical protein